MQVRMHTRVVRMFTRVATDVGALGCLCCFILVSYSSLVSAPLLKAVCRRASHGLTAVEALEGPAIAQEEDNISCQGGL